MKRLALILITACCTVQTKKQEVCVSACGMLFEGRANGAMSCDQIQRAEDESRKLMDKFCDKDDRLCLKNSCFELFGWQIETQDADAFMYCTDLGCSSVRTGSSDCGVKVMTLARATDWKQGSFPHELVHVAQDCRPLASWKESASDKSHGSGHNGWTKNGVYDALKELRGQ